MRLDYALLEAHHEIRRADCLVVLCEWGASGTAIVRKTGFPLRIWEDGEHFSVTLTDTAECPWQGIPDIQMLERAQSLAHPQKADVFHITDHMLSEDRELMAYFGA